jgi:hypothetical protein
MRIFGDDGYSLAFLIMPVIRSAAPKGSGCGGKQPRS